jgi:hypothetical protein
MKIAINKFNLLIGSNVIGEGKMYTWTPYIYPNKKGK